jgi:hypothetical protein
MRPLKPFALRLGGLIAAVFGAVFFGAHTGTTAPAPVKGLLPDLQSKRVTQSTDIVVSRDTKPDDKTPQPQPHFPAHDFSSDDTLRVSRDLYAQPAPKVAGRLSDQRLRLLIGTVELRI